MKNLADPLRRRIQTITRSLAPGTSRHAMLGRRFGFAVLCSCAALLAQPCVATPGQWEYTGSLNTGRGTYTATLLLDGRVLVASGEHPVGRILIHSTELYDPATGNWTETGK